MPITAQLPRMSAIAGRARAAHGQDRRLAVLVASIGALSASSGLGAEGVWMDEEAGAAASIEPTVAMRPGPEHRDGAFIGEREPALPRGQVW